MKTVEEFEASLGNVLNSKWGELLGSKLIEIEQLKFQLEMKNRETEELRKKLHEAEIKIITEKEE